MGVELTAMSLTEKYKNSFEKWLQQQENQVEALNYIRNDYKTNTEIILEDFASKCRRKYKFNGNAILNSAINSENETENDSESKTLTVDSFLYPDEFLDDKCHNNKFSRNYCTKCNSTCTKPFEFISHSFSTEELCYVCQEICLIFNNCKNRKI